MKFALSLLIVYLILLNYCTSFFQNTQIRLQNRSPLFMGRAAAVRANTKAKTDAAKAKNNGRFAKKIIIAVKANGKYYKVQYIAIYSIF